MNAWRILSGSVAAALLAAGPAASMAQPAARGHVHGQIKLEVVVQGPSVVIEMNAPLDNFVGFERAPRTDEERKAVDDVIAQLRAADQLFQIDPIANCKLGPVTLRSPVLGLGKVDGDAVEGHADLDGTFAFNCTNAPATKFIDLAMFTSFKGLRQIDADITAPQGQFKRTLKRPNPRLAWSR